MFFTRDDFRKIEDWLKHRTVRDTEFPSAEKFSGKECFPIVQEGENRIASFCQIVSRIAPDFLNTSLNKEAKTLNEAACSIPLHRRKPGLVITFFTEKGNWAIYQFKGTNLNQWTTKSCWRNIYDEAFDEFIKLYPDEEDITEVIDDGKSYIKFKDRLPNSLEFIGKGKLILRRNITGSLACAIDDEDHYVNILTQEMVSRSNMIYVIQYDFDLNGESIVIPSNCTLLFQGGSFNNGTLVLSKTSILGAFKYSDIGDVNILGSFTTGQVMSFVEADRTLLKWYDGTEWKLLLDITDYNTIMDKIVEVVTEYNNALEQKINNKLSTINNKIDDINDSINSIHTDISDIETDISNINTTIENINTSIENINSSGNTTNNSITEINNEIENIQNDISNLNETINNLTSIGGDVSGLVNQINDLNSRVNNLVDEVENLKNNSGGGTGSTEPSLTEEQVRQIAQDEINTALSGLQTTVNQYIQEYIQNNEIASGATSVTVTTPTDTVGTVYRIDSENNITIEVPDTPSSTPTNETLTVKTHSGNILGTYDGTEKVTITLPENTGSSSGGEGGTSTPNELLTIVDHEENVLGTYNGEIAQTIGIPPYWAYSQPLIVKAYKSPNVGTIGAYTGESPLTITLPNHPLFIRDPRHGTSIYNGEENVTVDLPDCKALNIKDPDGKTLLHYDPYHYEETAVVLPIFKDGNKPLTINYEDASAVYDGKTAVEVTIPKTKEEPILFSGTLSRNHVNEEFSLLIDYIDYDLIKRVSIGRPVNTDNVLHLYLESDYSLYIGGIFTNIVRYSNENIADDAYDTADIRYTNIQAAVLQNKVALPVIAFRGIGSKLKSSLMGGSEDISKGIAINPYSDNNVDYILGFNVLVIGKRVRL